MQEQDSARALTRRQFSRMAVSAAAAAGLPRHAAALEAKPDIRLEIAPYTLEASPKHHIKTLAYNGQVPGPLLRVHEGEPYLVEIANRSADPDIVHWHGLFLPSEIDGASEEGTPMIVPGATARFTLVPRPAGFRWYHTHVYAGNNLTRAQYGGEHGFLLVEPRTAPGAYDREVFLGLHDWQGQMLSSDDGSMNPVYEVTTINGRMLGFGDPVQVRQGERVLVHVLNSSPTEVHWIAFSGHRFTVVALDGNTLAEPRTVDQLRLAPAERVSALVTMDNPGVWVLGEVRKHVQATGMGIVFEYAGAGGKPVWVQPQELVWSYRAFAQPAGPSQGSTRLPLVFDSKFQGHGSEELWRINGLSYPQNSAPGRAPLLRKGERYRMVMQNHSLDDHPMHLHRHTFDVVRLEDGTEISGLRKDVVLVHAGKSVEVEFVADNPGPTLFHCHQQDHMDRGFMQVFQYA